MAYLGKRCGIYYVSFKDRDGTRKRVSCATSVKADAKVILQQYANLEINNRFQLPIKKVNVSITEALQSFKEAIRQEPKAEKSILNDLVLIGNIERYIEAKQITDFKEFKPQEYITDRISIGTKPSSLYHDKRILGKFYRYCLKHNYTTSNPIPEIKLPKATPALPQYYTKDELEKIYSVTREPYRTIFRFMANTGLRKSELGNLSWNDYDQINGSLIIRPVDGCIEKRIGGNKTKRTESIPLNSIALEIIKERKRLMEHPELIFTNHKGEHLTLDNIYTFFTRTLRRVKLTGHPHLLRHSFASHLVQSGVSLYIVKELLRHSSIEDTEIYSHLSEESTKRAVQSLCL
jgi:site-specific recombinase XerD